MTVLMTTLITKLRIVLRQAVPGVPDLENGLNPATWMLQISSTGMEASLGIDFADVYRESKLFQCVPALHSV